ncbi:hypothetical protein V499_08561 [Pseudogymnoascus sp. VKM F-103]|nr:hypothetical protein V499_08561 [Pseudogymnoascus sp. VKM F-103]
MTQNPPPATGMSSYDTKSASSENPSHCEWLSRARGRRHQEDGALNPAMAQITLTPGTGIDRPPRSGYEERAEIPSPAREKQAAISLLHATGTGSRSTSQKAQQRAFSTRVPGTGPKYPPFRPTSRPPSQEQGQDQRAKASASTIFRPAAQEQATINNGWRANVAKIRLT